VVSLVLAAGTAALTGCSSSDVTLDSRPTDSDSAQGLAELVAQTADCGSFEYYDDAAMRWDFTCQDGDRTFVIRTVGSSDVKRSTLQDWAGSASPVKAGKFFLVQEFEGSGGAGTAADLEGFPGELQEAAAT
jgi:hypothetical protein